MSDEKKPTKLDDLVSRGAALRGEAAWKPSQALLDAVAEYEKIDALPDPPAPDPVVLVPEKGGHVLVTEEEAAEVYVGPTDIPGGLSPRMPTGPVRIRADIDPRRQVTLPSIRTDVFDVEDPPPRTVVESYRKMVRLPADYSDRESGEWQIPPAHVPALFDNEGVKEDVEAYRSSHPEPPPSPEELLVNAELERSLEELRRHGREEQSRMEAVRAPATKTEAEPPSREEAGRDKAAREEPVSVAPIAPPASRHDARRRGVGFVVGAVLFVAGAVVTMAIVKRSQPEVEVPASAPAVRASGAAAVTTARSVASAPIVGASASATVSAPVVAASASASPSASPSEVVSAVMSASPAVSAAPHATSKPRDASSAAPKPPSAPSASVSPSAMPSAPATAAPSAPPATTATGAPPPYEEP